MPELFIGAKLRLLPVAFESNKCFADNERAKMPCEVIYINKPHRFFRVRFTFPNGNSFTESFKYMLPCDRPKKAALI